MIRSIIAVGLVVGICSAVVAQSDPIATRRNIMKGIGGATRTGGLMAKGDQPFDLAKAQDIFKVYLAATESSPKLYPDDTKTGGETTANPKIWEDKAGFQAGFDAWAKDIQKAQADVKDLDTFKPAFATLTKACGSCHQTFRVKT